MTIRIQRFQIPVHIGVTEKERLKKQKIYISLELGITVLSSIQNDKIEGTVDYRKISSVIQDIAKLRHWNLMENLASHIIKAIMKIDNKINCVEITIEKTNTYSYQLADYIAIIMNSRDMGSGQWAVGID